MYQIFHRAIRRMKRCCRRSVIATFRTSPWACQNPPRPRSLGWCSSYYKDSCQHSPWCLPSLPALSGIRDEHGRHALKPPSYSWPSDCSFSDVSASPLSQICCGSRSWTYWSLDIWTQSSSTHPGQLICAVAVCLRMSASIFWMFSVLILRPSSTSWHITFIVSPCLAYLEM